MRIAELMSRFQFLQLFESYDSLNANFFENSYGEALHLTYFELVCNLVVMLLHIFISILAMTLYGFTCFMARRAVFELYDA